jgi:hypothetical protein
MSISLSNDSSTFHLTKNMGKVTFCFPPKVQSLGLPPPDEELSYAHHLLQYAKTGQLKKGTVPSWKTLEGELSCVLKGV